MSQLRGKMHGDCRQSTRESPGRHRFSTPVPDNVLGKGIMPRPTVHIVGAGFSGLSAAVHLSFAAGADIVLHERVARAGGRRRSYYDEALGLTIDSGNHFLLASWRATLGTIAAIGASDRWRGEDSGDIPFADMASGERWKLRPNPGRIPWWVSVPSRRAPRTLTKDYFSLAKLMRAPASATVADLAPSEGVASERIWRAEPSLGPPRRRLARRNLRRRRPRSPTDVSRRRRFRTRLRRARADAPEAAPGHDPV
jgi:phytoene dehydrogenase-like protein